MGGEIWIYILEVKNVIHDAWRMHKPIHQIKLKDERMNLHVQIKCTHMQSGVQKFFIFSVINKVAK